MKRTLHVATLLLVIGCSLSAQAQKRIIRGRGAATLYVCDDKPVLECWFALRNNYCEIDLGVNYEWIPSKPGILVVWGEVGEQIWRLTHDCSDHDVMTPFHFGRQGVSCEVLAAGNHTCSLEIDEIY